MRKSRNELGKFLNNFSFFVETKHRFVLGGNFLYSIFSRMTLTLRVINLLQNFFNKVTSAHYFFFSFFWENFFRFYPPLIIEKSFFPFLPWGERARDWGSF